MKHLDRLSQRIFGTPLLVERRKLDVILSVLAPRLGIEAPTIDATLLAQLEVGTRGSERKPYQVTPEGIAVIDVSGSLVNRIDANPFSGLTAYEQLGNEILDAVTTDAIKGILLRVDSWGGEVGGSFDLADVIAEAGQSKPIVAAADDSAFSAAYLIASAASEIYVTRTGGVGSIGVIALHIDQSEFNEKLGIKVDAIFAGSAKNQLTPHEPLSDDARAVLKGEIDRIYGLFVGAVAKRRGLSEKAVRGTEAGLFFGENAVSAGLADKIGTVRDAYASLVGRIAPATSSRVAASAATAEITDKEDTRVSEQVVVKADANAATAPVPATEPTKPVIDAKAIADLCVIAGQPGKVAKFIQDGLSVDEVRGLLLKEKAAASEATDVKSNHAGLAQTALGSIEQAAAAMLGQKPQLTKEQATREALFANPALYEQYLAANPAQTGGTN